MKLCLHPDQPAGPGPACGEAFPGRPMGPGPITANPPPRQRVPAGAAGRRPPTLDPPHPRPTPPPARAAPDGSPRRAVGVLRESLARYPRRHAVMCLELVQGEGGYNAAPPAFFRALIDVLKAAGVAVWMDEVQTFARTETPFAFQSFG